MYNLFTKTIYDKRSFIVGWGLGMAFIGYLMTVFYPAFHQDNGLGQLINSLPPAFKGLVGNLDNLKEVSTYLGSQLFDIRMPIFLSVMTILLATGLTVTEEEKGQLRTLIGLPISRAGVVLQKWLAGLAICLIAMVATVIGIKIGLMTINESLDWMVLVRLGAMTGLLSAALLTIIFGVGLATGKKGLTTGLGVVITVGSFLLTTFAQSVDWLSSYEKLSILHYFHATDIAKGTINLSDVILYCALIVIPLVFAFIGFRRRDVR